MFKILSETVFPNSLKAKHIITDTKLFQLYTDFTDFVFLLTHLRHQKDLTLKMLKTVLNQLKILVSQTKLPLKCDL